MTYTRPIICTASSATLLGNLGFEIKSHDGVTVLVPRSTEGIIYVGQNKYLAAPFFDSAWYPSVLVAWTLNDTTAVDIYNIDIQLTSDIIGEEIVSSPSNPETIVDPSDSISSGVMSQILAAIEDGTKSVTVDGTTTTAHSLSELIEADRYLRQRDAATRVASRGGWPGRLLRIVPPGANGV